MEDAGAIYHVVSRGDRQEGSAGGKKRLMHDPAATDSRSGIARAAARIDSREGQRPRLTQISTAASPQFQKAADIPDDLAAQLGAGFQNLGRAVLESLAAEAYSKEVLSLEQIRRMLGLGSLWEAQAMLSRHGMWPDQSAEEILADVAGRLNSGIPKDNFARLRPEANQTSLCRVCLEKRLCSILVACKNQPNGSIMVSQISNIS